MGSCLCKGNDPTTKTINAKMKESEKYDNSLIKLLFLGPGGSGKSTIFKQLQWLHGDGFTTRDIIDLKQHIESQIITQMQDAIKYYLPENVENAKLQNSIDFVRNCDAAGQLDNEIASQIQYIYLNDERLKGIFQKHHTKKILDESTEYFWNSIERITDPNYEPDRTDIINIRNRTTGIIEKKFTINEANFHIFDVGGQQSERKKWIKCFDNVKSLIFVIALSSYHEIMFEDEKKNYMDDAMELFDKTINNSHFLSTPIILFLNKSDLFANKIKDLAITVCPAFADFGQNNNPVYINNNPNDYIQTTSFIKSKFESINKNNETRSTYVHITCAMDDQNIKTVFNDVTRIVMKEIKNAISAAHML